MAGTGTRSLAAPLLFLNLIMYFIVLGFASWCSNNNGQTAHPNVKDRRREPPESLEERQPRRSLFVVHCRVGRYSAGFRAGVQGDKRGRVERMEAEGGGGVRYHPGVHAAALRSSAACGVLQQQLRAGL
ncbi:UNVERIFIED_CONTAM: Membrane protein PM19L [Sesamum angustifolium]|uniref:Membrane protein PM19L n=1 Tax=Sesamum angustifolium TaxID=2727405 RepID=A0AAW2P0N2_9LAMI